MARILEKIETYILYTTVFLLPLVVLPIFPNPFFLPKLAILCFGITLALLLRAMRTIVSGSLEFSYGKFDLPIILLALAYLVSAILRTPNKMEAFFIPGNATVILAGALLYFLLNQLKLEEKKNVLLVTFLSGILVSLICLLSISGILVKIPQLPAMLKISSFNSLGGSLPAILFLGTLLPLGIGFIVFEKEYFKTIFFGVCLIVLVFGLGISFYNVVSTGPAKLLLLDYKTSWAVAVDTMKDSPVLGIGPGNYLTAFNRFRPLSYNQSDLWAVKFTSSRNFYFTVLTETGFSGAAGLIFLFLVIFKILKNQKPEEILKNTDLVSLLTLLVLLALFSAPPVLVVLLFLLLVAATKTEKMKLNLLLSSESSFAPRIPSLLISLPLIIAIVVFAFFSSRYLIAEAKFKQALDALARNDGTLTYNLIREAINLNPYVDRYHASYAQVNIGLAQALSQKEEISDQDRTTITQLVQQAIREGKATVALNPQRAGNWEIMAATYRAIIPFAQGADIFSVQTLSQAVSLDPINPALRISLGGIYYALGNYDQAIRIFELATFAKPDFANAHYNLAASYREKGETEKAINEMNVVLSLIDPLSSDYQLAKAELENLQKNLPPVEAPEGGELVPPQPVEESVIQPPIELPEESSPPAAPEGTPAPVPEGPSS